VLLLHDISDVALELTKINVYLKHRHGKFRLEHDLFSSFGFLSFAVSWYVFRLYWFPLKVLYAGLYGAAAIAPHDIPFVPCFCGMLWILLAMNCYWFSFILILLFKVATGQAKEIDDTREFKENENGTSSKNNSDKNGALKELSQNGVVHEKIQ
jgi:ceramide synthetase